MRTIHYLFLVMTMLAGPRVVFGGADFGHIAIIGDSITQASGNAYNSTVYSQNACRGYRWELFKSLVDAGARFDFAGSLANNYLSDSAYPTWRGIPFCRAHEGHFGWRARELVNGPDTGHTTGNRGTGGLAQWLDNAKGGYTPDTAIVMIGINDLADGTTTAQLSNYVSAVVGLLQSRNPNVRVYLCHLLHVGLGHSLYASLNNAVDDYNANKLPGLAAAKTTAHSVVSVIDMIGPTNNGANVWVARPGGWNPDAGEMASSDVVHPNSRGERHIAGRIAAALSLVSEWTPVAIANGNFESGFAGAGTASCRPNGWSIFGSPNTSAVPRQITDYQVVAESVVDTVATGTGSSGSSYVIAGTANTGIEQTLAETLAANRHYLLQASLYSGSAALTSGDWGLEVWAGNTRVGQADNQVKLNTYSTGTGSQIGSKLTEVTVEFEGNDFPAANGQPLTIRLISRNVARYVGFEDVRLCWKPSPAASPSRRYQVYVLTGQSNSLGTDSGPEINKLPGGDPADAEVRFWWHNVSGDIYGISASPGYSVGSSGGFWKTIRAQFGFNTYANVVNAWGPEINFARTLWHAGQTNFVIVKASRGGGGNSLWCKTNADNHMYVHVTNTVIRACNRLAAEGHTFEIAGLLYLQGESDSAAEQATAGVRFKYLVDNLRVDLPGASGMKGYMVGNLTTAATRAQQEAIAAAHPAYLFYADSMDLTDEWVPDGLHVNKKAKLVNGARFADLVLGRAARFDSSAGYSAVFGQQYGNSSAGVTPLAGLTTVLTEHSPLLQGWSETPGSSAMAASLAAALGQSAASLSPDPVGVLPAWSIIDADATGAAYSYTRKFTGTQTTNFVNTGWDYSLKARFPAAFPEAPSFFFQYGGVWSRWIVQLRRDPGGALLARFTGPTGVCTATLQSVYDDGYHCFLLRKTAGGEADAELVFDGLSVGRVSETAADGGLVPGVHFGTQSAAGKGAVNIASVDFTAAVPAATNTLIYLPGPNGTISGAQTQSVAFAGSGTPVTAIPNLGYHFTGWSDGRTDNPRVDSNTVFDLTVRAGFASAELTLTPLPGSEFALAWPEEWLGCVLEYQTNTLAAGLGSAWLAWPGSTGVTSLTISNDPSVPTAFFRLRFQ